MTSTPATQEIRVGKTTRTIAADASPETVADTYIEAAEHEVTLAARMHMIAQRQQHPGETEEQTQTRLSETAGALEAASEQAATYRGEYTGWSRFFLVSASNGHIHRNMSCTTCNNGRRQTLFVWLTDMSGLTEAEAVEAYGGILCTVCFPSAPSEWTEGEPRSKIENRWWTAVLRSPEGKALVKTQKKVTDLESKIERGPGEIERLTEYAERQKEWAARAEAKGDTDLAASHTRRFNDETERVVKAERRFARAQKALPKAQAAVEPAQAALDAAIAAAGLA